jgi:hypothetical protein
MLKQDDIYREKIQDKHQWRLFTITSSGVYWHDLACFKKKVECVVTTAVKQCLGHNKQPYMEML